MCLCEKGIKARATFRKIEGFFFPLYFPECRFNIYSYTFGIVNERGNILIYVYELEELY